MAKRILAIRLEILTQTLEGGVPVLYSNTVDTALYADGKKVDGAFGSTTIVVITKSLGEVAIELPYQQGLADEIESRFSFGDAISLPEICDIEDGKISFYDGTLRVRLIGTYIQGGK